MTLPEELRLDQDFIALDAGINEALCYSNDPILMLAEDSNPVELSSDSVEIFKRLARDSESLPLAIDFQIESDIAMGDGNCNRVGAMGHGESPAKSADATNDADRAASIHTAKVYLAQSRHFTGRARSFSFTLLNWAANARRRAMAFAPASPTQATLF